MKKRGHGGLAAFSFHKDTWNLLIQPGYYKTLRSECSRGALLFFGGATTILDEVQLSENLMNIWINLMQTYISLLLWCELADFETMVSSYAGKQFLPHD